MPSGHTVVVSSKEAAQDIADIMGYLLQQTEVFITKPIPNKSGWKAAVDIVGPGLGTPEIVTEYWSRVQQKYPKVRDLGFSPMREQGREGIRVVWDQGGEKFIEQLQRDLEPVLEAVAEEMGLEGIAPAVTKVEAEKRGNKWGKQTKGEGYMEGLKRRYGPRIQRTLERDHRQNIQRLFEEELGAAEERTAKKEAA